LRIEAQISTLEDRRFFLRLALRPPETAAAGRRPLLLCVLLDRSGSMGDALTSPGGAERAAKIALAKDAVTEGVRRLPAGAEVMLASFADTARLDLGPAPASDGPRLGQALSAIGAGGNTDLADAFALVVEEIRQVRGRDIKILLLSDGLANRGETDPAALASRIAASLPDGATVSCIGVGDDWNAYLLGHLSRSGGGEVHHAAGGADLRAFLRAEVEAATQITARRAVLEIALPPGVALAHGNLQYPMQVEDHAVTLLCGNLSRPKRVYLPLVLDGPAEGRIAVRCRYRGADDVPGEAVASADLAALATDEARARALREEAERVLSETVLRDLIEERSAGRSVQAAAARDALLSHYRLAAGAAQRLAEVEAALAVPSPGQAVAAYAVTAAAAAGGPPQGP
jgi:hypothetical protein